MNHSAENSNIVLDIVDTMQPSMRINLQNVKENHQKLALTLPRRQFFIAVSKVGKIMVYCTYLLVSFETLTKISPLGEC